ncbi:hypothetical protein M0R45_016017 [Rubus argutus]|uniref:DUF7755 domain-containing protein n=1 Tax=Rubus argutus TaxID=59490 RepID=A0AAW1XS78_RUBAR
MKSISLRHAISATHDSYLWRTSVNPEKPFQTKRFRLHNPTGRFQILSKLSDFRDYAKPSRLLQATEVNVCANTSVEKGFLSLRDYESQSLYKVKLGTSNVYGSSLSDLTAGILFCVIDENGNSILQRIPSNLRPDHSKEDLLMSSPLRDLKLEKLKLFGSVLNQWESKFFGGNRWRETWYIGFSYNFLVEDILLGEGSDSSMVELRPCLVTKLSGVDPFTMLRKP